jgi:RHS repeat-associated protein
MLKRIARQIIAMTVCVTFTLSSSFAQTITYFHNDPGGTPQMATDSSGAVVWKETYKPYGEKVLNSANSASNALWFAGKPYDSNTGLSYFGARYYDPTVGRFIGMDPKAPDAQNLYSFNRFAYGNDNPYRYVDPDGRNAVAIGLLFAAVLFYIGTFNVLPKQRQDAEHPAISRSILDVFKSESADSPPPPANGNNVSTGGATASGTNNANGNLPPDDDRDKNKDEKPASEKTARDIAKRIERDLGKDARRDFHDAKESGSGDRTLSQLKQDARDLYRAAGKEIPNWLK